MQYKEFTMKYLICFAIFLTFLSAPVYSQVLNDSLDNSTQEGDSLVLKEPPKELKQIIQRITSYRNDDYDTTKTLAKNLQTGLSGLLIDNTLTKMGRDFYSFFYDNWDAPDIGETYSVAIEEKPAPGRGSLIQIKVNREKVFENRISPRREVLQAYAEYAVKQVYNYLNNYKEIQKQLGEGDMQGTGIY